MGETTLQLNFKLDESVHIDDRLPSPKLNLIIALVIYQATNYVLFDYDCRCLQLDDNPTCLSSGKGQFPVMEMLAKR